ncbi:hypothetical protein RFI_20504 [Reticulomyxa filosa]|uniref:Uncharacterized protein n=1 Tax=Reticulomyxa filosa TaxID=46433 RepID=X6MTR2_RETFI|nr:hypothetical protein RFI_20504 [Reticulomyxa filosa]|eukprot:ETO16837.1 hypothetical protein RFI_20504 [Reticulomyxa filosa]
MMELRRHWKIMDIKYKMPIIKVLLSKTEDVVKILKGNDIQIGYSMVNAKYVSIVDWQITKRQNYKNDTIKHKCVLSRKHHPSDLLQCNVCDSQSKRKACYAAFMKKEFRHIPIKSNVKRQRIILILMLPKKRTNRKRLQNKKSDADEIPLLRCELADIKSALEISCPDQKKPLLFCSFYRNLSVIISIFKHSSKNYNL